MTNDTTPSPRTWLFFFPAPGTRLQPPEIRAITYERLMNRWAALSIVSLLIGAVHQAIVSWP